MIWRSKTPLTMTFIAPYLCLEQDLTGKPVAGLTGSRSRASFLKTIADAVQRLDHIEVVVACLELLAQPLDVAVDGAVVDIDLIVISRVHQGVAALHHAGAARQRVQDQKLGDGERHRLILPGE